MYDSIKAWTCKLGRIEKLYAFTYQPQRPEKDVNGWLVYDARSEWKRLGISEKGADKGWRISTVNKDYGVGGQNRKSEQCILSRSSSPLHTRRCCLYLQPSQTTPSTTQGNIVRAYAYPS